jgi:hypothetical protein
VLREVLLKRKETGEKITILRSLVSTLGPQPGFYTTAVDLFGPLKYKDMVRKRITDKGWGIIFVCTASSAVHLELTESLWRTRYNIIHSVTVP